MIIYRLINKLNGMTYIGQTSYKLNKRINCHKTAKTFIGSAIRKYGINNFYIEIIDENSKTREELNEKEEYYISFYNSVSPNGYNIHLGGDAKNMSPETKAKLSNDRKGIAPMIAIKKRAELSSKSVKRICPITKEIKVYKNTKSAARELNISATQISKCAKYPNKGYISGGYKWEYVDSKNVINSELTRTEHHWENKKKPVKLEKEGQIFEFDSRKEAALFINTLPNNISRVMTNQRRSIKGYTKCLT